MESIFNIAPTQEQKVSFTVRMERPDRKRPVIRRYFDTKVPDVHSLAQLAGFLTHKLFGDNERGGAGTLYHITVRDTSGDMDGFTIRRTASGKYVHI